MSMTQQELFESGKLISQSEMFGKINPAEGYMIAAICEKENISYLEFAETYNWMHHSASMKADAMLAKFCDRGGEYEIVKREPDIASIKVTFKGKEKVFSVTWDDVKDEPFTQNKEGSTKSNYATPRKRMQSLWSRVVSDAVHTICPQACKGLYTTEEAETFQPQLERDLSKVLTWTGTPETSANIEIYDFSKDKKESTPPPAEDDDFNYGHNVNYHICPIGDESVKGFSWKVLGSDILNMALGLDDLEEGYKAAIQKVLNERAEMDKIERQG